MAWITQGDLDKEFGSADNIAKLYPIALAKMQELTCNALSQESEADMTGVVCGDGITVKLPAWFTSVSKIATSQGRILSEDLWTFSPATSADSIDPEDTQPFGRIVTLKDERNTGEVLTITGKHGFASLPGELKTALMGLMSAYLDRATGADRVTSKSIEDVSVSQNSNVDQTPESTAMETYQPIVDKWSLCDDKAHIGTLAFPTKQWHAPYYIGSEERLGGNQHAIGSVM